MKAILAIVVVSLLTACTAVPVNRDFPNIPLGLNKGCSPLKETQKTDKLSEVLLTVTENYALYHECELKTELWMQWYREQKDIFDSVK